MKERVAKVLERIMQSTVNCEFTSRVFAEEIDTLLDKLQQSDFFGTEAQCDPRGDFRNGRWSVVTVIEEKE